MRTARTSTQPAIQPVSQLKVIKPTKKFCANRETAVVLHGTVRVGLLLAGWLTLVVVVVLLLLLPWVPCIVVIVAGVSLSFLRTFYGFVSTDLRWSMSGAAEQQKREAKMLCSSNHVPWSLGEGGCTNSKLSACVCVSAGKKVPQKNGSAQLQTKPFHKGSMEIIFPFLKFSSL